MREVDDALSQAYTHRGRAGGSGGPTDEFIDARPPEACEKMDILFVVDNSFSMENKQDALVAYIPMMFDVLQTYQTMSGSLLDYRIAVTTTAT